MTPSVFWLIAICCLAGSALAQSPVLLTVGNSSSFAIPSDFSGLSFETGSQRPNRHGVSGNLFSATNAQLVTLFRNLGLRNLRVGGGSVEGKRGAFLNRTVLIVDSDPAIGRMLNIVLESEGYSVLWSRNGADGVTEAFNHQPDAII